MKSLIKPLFFALSFGIAASTATFADIKPADKPAVAASYKTGIYTSTSGKLNIALDKEIGGSVDVLLRNDAGKVLYSYRVGKNERQYRGRLNMSDLTDGIYHLEITNGAETTRQTITLSTSVAAAPQRVVLTDALAAK